MIRYLIKMVQMMFHVGPYKPHTEVSKSPKSFAGCDIDIQSIAVYAESLLCCLLENDWYEGDFRGVDSTAYYKLEDKILSVVGTIKKLDPSFHSWFSTSEQYLNGFNILIDLGKTDLDATFLKKIRPDWLKSRRSLGMEEI